MTAILHGFHATEPTYSVEQHQSLRWLIEAHIVAEIEHTRLEGADAAAFATRLDRVFRRVACGPDAIATRRFVIPDLGTTETRWDRDGLYDFARRPHGAGTAERMHAFQLHVRAYLEHAYAEAAPPPDELVHVTCTGYVSPSGPQELVARRRWPTRVTHAYHMGCYAAIPALRVAAALAGEGRADVVHTELCSLHLDPTDHRLDQLVVQSLFADGLIRYSISTHAKARGLRALATAEQIVPDSAEAMTWIAGDHGMHMTLARDVPERVAGALREFVLGLLRSSGLGADRLRTCIAAIHPGGPRILDGVERTLELRPDQLSASRTVLRERGNMSSATLPHIWGRIVADPASAPGSLVLSLAFGPGLTICGALFEVQ